LCQDDAFRVASCSGPWRGTDLRGTGANVSFYPPLDSAASVAPGAPTSGVSGVVPIRVVLVDDDAVIRNLVRHVLEDAESEILVVGEAADGASGLELWRELRPDLTILDQHMPGLHGIDLARCILGEAATEKLLLCTAVPESVTVEAALLGIPVLGKFQFAGLADLVRLLARAT
jgi:CheY-like chemotaxis protein